jgi:hypothetical protein
MRLVSSAASAVLFVFLVVDLHSRPATAASRAVRGVTTPNLFFRPPNSVFIPTRHHWQIHQVWWPSRSYPFPRPDGFRYGTGYGGTWYGGTLVPAGPGIYGSGGYAYGSGGYAGYSIGTGPDAPYTGSAIFYPPETKKKKSRPKNDDGNKNPDDESNPDTRSKKKSSLPMPQIVYGLHPAFGGLYPPKVIDSDEP